MSNVAHKARSSKTDDIDLPRPTIAPRRSHERCVECADGTRFLLDPRVSDEAACRNHGGVKTTWSVKKQF